MIAQINIGVFTLQVTRAMAATTQAPQLRMPRATFQAPRPTGSLAMSRALTLAVTLTLAQAARAMAAAVATLAATPVVV